MSLHKIEVENFKSYKGCHTIGPFDKFSCIVGPNGCGKSNILDAISFVLNVPNSCLRVKHLKNLIEHSASQSSVRIWIGTKKFERKLLRQTEDRDGSLLLDNQLNQDVTNSTTCKYLVDNIKVTQKKYNEELESLNILSKIRNFAIYQGDIIKTDVNLLSMIEHTCGSNQYIDEFNQLNEKITVMNKELNVKYERRKDILSLIKEMNEVKTKEKNFENYIVQKEEAQRQLYEYEIRKKRQVTRSLKTALNKLKHMKEHDHFDENMKSVNVLRSETARLQKEYFEKETELSLMKSKNVQHSEFDYEGKTRELETLSKSFAKVSDDLKRLPERLIFNSNIISKENFESIYNMKEQEYKQKTAELEKQLTEITLKNFDKINRRDQIQALLKQYKNKQQKVAQRNKEIIKENEQKREKQCNIDKEIKRLNAQIEEKASSYEKIITDEEVMNKEFNNVMRDLLLNKAKKSDMTKRSMIKAIVENLKIIFAGVYGRVIDVIEPTQKKYEMAVGVLLSKYDQAVIVDNEKTALDCLRYIKESHKCKLTFLPLNKLKHMEVCESITTAGNLAKDCILYEESIEKAISFIFKNAVVVDTTEQAKEIVYGQKYKGVVCTLNGTLFSNNGLITGGKGTTNKFEETLIDSLLAKRKQILQDLKMIKDRKDAFADVELVKQKIKELESIKNTISFEQPEPEELIDFSKQEQELKELENALAEYEACELSIKESKKQVERAVFGELLSSIGMHSVNEYKERMKAELRREELLIASETAREKLANLQEEIRENNTMPLERTADTKKEITRLEGTLNKLYVELEAAKERLRSSSQTLKGQSEKRDELNRSILNHELQISKFEEEMKDLVKYAELELNCTLGESSSEEEENESNWVTNKKKPVSDEEIEKQKALVEELTRLVNENIPTVSAKDASIQSRYAKANREYEVAKEALVQCKDQLQTVRSERMGLFSGCFELVSSEITEIYRQLTLGDVYEQGNESNAYLVFEGDPFVNNVRYYLMPPGKRFVAFEELSGGERSIATLAFVLALGRYKKAPFYIFDEVDSALDNLNVERLASFFSSSSSQFLVVSLKPLLFSRAESLFGVYRCPRESTSKVLSLKIS